MSQGAGPGWTSRPSPPWLVPTCTPSPGPCRQNKGGGKSAFPSPWVRKRLNMWTENEAQKRKTSLRAYYLQQIKTNMQASPWNYWEEKGTLFFLSNIPATTNLKCAKCQSCCLFIDISFRINVIIKRLFIYFPHSESYFSTRSHTLQKQIFLSPHQNLVIVQPGEKYFQAPQLGWMS